MTPEAEKVFEKECVGIVGLGVDALLWECAQPGFPDSFVLPAVTAGRRIN